MKSWTSDSLCVCVRKEGVHMWYIRQQPFCPFSKASLIHSCDLRACEHVCMCTLYCNIGQYYKHVRKNEGRDIFLRYEICCILAKSMLIFTTNHPLLAYPV